MTKALAAWVGLVLSAVPLLSQTNAQGLRLVVRTELRSTADGKVGGARPLWLPDGSVEIEYLTDGRSFRAVQHGRMAGRPDGTVALSMSGDSGDPKRYLLDPSSRTYSVLGPRRAGTSTRGSSTVTRPGVFETIAGYRAEKVVLGYREALPAQGATPVESRVEVESWCTSALRVPPGLVMDLASAFLDDHARQQFEKTCPVVLRSVMRMSEMPGYELVSVATSVQKVLPTADMFRLPGGYTEVRK